jgi:hypothetical protein
MEAACESARHAVNALLRSIDAETDHRLGGEECEIWDPEDFELSDLNWLKEIDDRLCARGHRHALDVLLPLGGGWIESGGDVLRDVLRRAAETGGRR